MRSLKVRLKINGITRSALFAAMLCMLCPLAVPVGPVPVTMGTFVVFLAGIVLEWKQAAAAVLVYLLAGLIGLPVFSGGRGGFGVFAGPTGGYLWSYLLMAILVSRMSKRGGWARAALANTFAALLCYLVGTIQFMAVADANLRVALALCVWPFMPFDVIKIIAAAVMGVRIRRRLHQAGLL